MKKTKPVEPPSGDEIIRNLDVDKLKSIITLAQNLRGKYLSEFYDNPKYTTKIRNERLKSNVETLSDLLSLLYDLKEANANASIDFTEQVEMSQVRKNK